MFEFKLVGMFNCIYKIEYSDKCDKIFIGRNEILGVFKENGFYFK